MQAKALLEEANARLQEELDRVVEEAKHTDETLFKVGQIVELDASGFEPGAEPGAALSGGSKSR